MTIEDLRSEAQSALDNLWVEKLLPFELEARQIEYLNHGEYIIRFHDSRLRSVTIFWTDGCSVGDLVRVAVVAGVKRMDVPPPELLEMFESRFH